MNSLSSSGADTTLYVSSFDISVATSVSSLGLFRTSIIAWAEATCHKGKRDSSCTASSCKGDETHSHCDIHCPTEGTM